MGVGVSGATVSGVRWEGVVVGVGGGMVDAGWQEERRQKAESRKKWKNRWKIFISNLLGYFHRIDDREKHCLKKSIVFIGVRE